MFFDVLAAVVRTQAAKDALVWRGRGVSYATLAERVAYWRQALQSGKHRPGTILGIVGDFSPEAVALLLAAIESGCVVAPAWGSSAGGIAERLRVGQIEQLATLDDQDSVTLTATGNRADHPLYQQLRAAGHPGLVLFSSGSTGEPKGTVHDLTRLLRKYEVPRKDLRTLAFLLFDHIGGLDTLFYSLANGSTLVIPEARTPETVCQAIASHRVQVLPTAPSFLNLLLLSGAYQQYDLSSLEYITYGAEMMPQATLSRCAQEFPGVKLLQKYGTSEVGTLRSSSRDADSLWVRIGGEGYQWRVVEGKLEISADSAMLGYLNAPSPFTADGWFMTGDCVEVDGEFVRCLGRESDLINVGGQKVHPSEVEAVIAEMPGIADVSVYGEKNLMLGQVVCARVQTVSEEPAAQVRAAVKRFCSERQIGRAHV